MSSDRVERLQSAAVRRVWVIGNSGSGKSTVARGLAERLGTQWVELDAIFHQPGWRPLDHEAFRARVAHLAAGDEWVVDGNYSAVADLVQARADSIVWLDLARSAVMRQLLLRTLTRLVCNVELWNGNRESWRSLFRRDPEQSILRWAWTRHEHYAERCARLTAAAAATGLTVVRLRSRTEIDRFLGSESLLE